MKIRNILSFWLFLVLVFSCSAQQGKYSKVPFLEINKHKIFLRYSTREDVEKVLGKTEIQEHFETGGEDFNWNDFTVCFYDDKTLSFHYSKEGSIIRITVSQNSPRSIKIILGNLKTVTDKEILVDGNESGDKNIVIDDDYITYTSNDLEANNINNSFWLNDSRMIQWYDAYYEEQWK